MELNAYLHHLYQTVDARRISLDARKAAGFTARGLVYGEFPSSTLLEVLATLPLSGLGLFVDLGAGAGRLVCAAALSGQFAEVHGIELLPELCLAARQRAEQLSRMWPDRSTRIQMIEGDLQTADLRVAEVVFAYATCFSVDTCDQIAAHFQTSPPGAWLLSVSRPLCAPHLELHKQHNIRLPWGETQIWIYRHR